MKIITPSGIVIELADGETIPAHVMKLMMDGAATPPAAPPAPAPEVIATGPAFLPLEEFNQATGAPRRRQQQQPDKCYLTKTEFDTMELLLRHPDGITSQRVAQTLGVTHSAASSTLNRIRTSRPYEDTTEPLITRVRNGLFKATALGARLTYLVGDKHASPKMNRKLGWGQQR